MFDANAERNWNDPGPHPWLLKRRAKKANPDEDLFKDDRPILRAVVFDFSSLSHVDSTCLQYSVALKRSLERYAGDNVQYHFASILSPYSESNSTSLVSFLADESVSPHTVKRALLAGGFGTGKGWNGAERPLEIAPVVNEGRTKIKTEHARRVQATHFQRRYPPSTASGTATPRPTQPGLRPLTEESDSDLAGSSSGRRGSDTDISEEPERDVEAARTQEEMEVEEKFALPGTHVGGSIWADSFPGVDGVHEEAPIVSHLFPRFHLDLSSAVAAAVGTEEW